MTLFEDLMNPYWEKNNLIKTGCFKTNASLCSAKKPKPFFSRGLIPRDAGFKPLSDQKGEHHVPKNQNVHPQHLQPLQSLQKIHGRK
jgi:hypothetical protein